MTCIIPNLDERIANFTMELIKNVKVKELATSLNQNISIFKGLIEDFYTLENQVEMYKAYYLDQRNKCISKKCESCVSLQQIVASKDNSIRAVVTILKEFNTTNNISVLNEVFKLLSVDGDCTALTPPSDSSEQIQVKEENFSKEKITPIKNSSQNMSLAEESISEIEGTPTGCTSPIIGSKIYYPQIKNVEKKKCSTNWNNTKMVKLTFPPQSRTPKRSGKMKQTRFNLTRRKDVNIVDLTCSPELVGGSTDLNEDKAAMKTFKQEHIDADDTILPSPTSFPLKPAFPTLHKSISNARKADSPSKFKKPATFSKLVIPKQDPVKTEPVDPNGMCVDNDIEESINLLQPRVIKKSLKQLMEKTTEVQVDNNESISLLQTVNDIQEHSKKSSISPQKRPLVENINVTNCPEESYTQMSVSLLNQKSVAAGKDIKDLIQKQQPLYKEPTVRKKAEKRALPGWSCEKCKNFYDILYKDNPEMLLKLMMECSKHRGRRDPARPSTPPGYWNPRWAVASDTEAFNRDNDAL